MKNSKEIAQLKKKKEDLDKLLGQEQWYSWNDAAKVDMERKLVEKQMHELMNEPKSSFRQTYQLRSQTQEKKFTVTDGTPDPLSGVISLNSPVGEKLARMKVGDKIEIGGEEFELIE